ncbi:MAG: glycine reductase, partial [Dehalococcoidia bacterium]
MNYPSVREVQFFLAHTPGLVQHGSKPSREIAKAPGIGHAIAANLRSYPDALAYAPHQVLLGNRLPETLWDLPAPWYENPLGDVSPWGPHGQMVGEEEFYGLL